MSTAELSVCPSMSLLGRRDATVKAARQQIARLCCMPEQAPAIDRERERGIGLSQRLVGAACHTAVFQWIRESAV